MLLDNYFLVFDNIFYNLPLADEQVLEDTDSFGNAVPGWVRCWEKGYLDFSTPKSTRQEINQ